MRGITEINRKRLLVALNKHDKLIMENPFLQKELEEFEKWHKDEKLRRDNAYRRKKAESDVSNWEER